MENNGKGTLEARFHDRPEAQQPRETGRAYLWFQKFLSMNNRKLQDLIDYAEEQRQLVKEGAEDGYFPAEGTVRSWVKKYKWHARAELWDARLREEAIAKMEEDRASNLEEFLKNDLEIVMDAQTQIKEYISQCKRIDDHNERCNVLFKLTKTYGDVRRMAGELLEDVMDKARKAAEDAEDDEPPIEEADYQGAPEDNGEVQDVPQVEYQEAAGG